MPYIVTIQKSNFAASYPPYSVTKSTSKYFICLILKICMPCKYFLPSGRLYFVGYFLFVQKLKFSQVPSVYFAFVSLEIGPPKILLQFMSKSVLMIFFYKNFIECGLIFGSLIHFEFIILYGVRQ